MQLSFVNKKGNVSRKCSIFVLWIYFDKKVIRILCSYYEQDNISKR